MCAFLAPAEQLHFFQIFVHASPMKQVRKYALIYLKWQPKLKGRVWLMLHTNNSQGNNTL
jgi:hypothetical protein